MMIQKTTVTSGIFVAASVKQSLCVDVMLSHLAALSVGDKSALPRAVSIFREKKNITNFELLRLPMTLSEFPRPGLKRRWQVDIHPPPARSDK